eukprot:scaffold104717_cov20-Prasinocladus_malaysianus.AAC.2
MPAKRGFEFDYSLTQFECTYGIIDQISKLQHAYAIIARIIALNWARLGCYLARLRLQFIFGVCGQAQGHVSA